VAAIPTYFYLGDRQINGSGVSGLTPQPGAQGSYWTNFANRPLVMQTVPTSGNAYQPWWDGTAGTLRQSNAATSTTVTVSPSPGWTVDEHAGKFVKVDAGVGAPVLGIAQRREILSNTADTLTVATAWATNPTNSTIHIEEGAWVKYDHIRSADILAFKVTQGTEGDNWFANQNGSFGATAMLMQLLKQRHSAAPYFRLFKRAYNVSGIAAWAAGAAWTNFQAEWADAAAKYGADTVDPTALILDCAFTDINDVNTSYLLQLITFIGQVRTFLSAPNLPILLVNPASAILQQTKTQTIGPQTIPYARIIRGVNSQLRGLVQNVRLVDMEGLEFAAENAFANLAGTLPTNPTDYSTDSHLMLGQKVYNEIVRHYADGPTLPVGGGIPTFVMIGDSQARGFSSPQYAVLGGEASLLGANTLANVMGNELIWDGADQQIEPYDLTINSNTVGDVTAQYYGPDATFIRRMGREFPNGVLLLKVASGGASMAAESLASGALGTFDPVANTLWGTLTAAWASLRAVALEELSATPDVLGVAVLLGDNDCRQTSDAAAFDAKLPGFVPSLRSLFTTRTTGGVLPVAFHLPPQHRDNGGQSVLGLPSAREAVRQSLLAYGLIDQAFGVAAEDGLELRRDDLIHYSGEANHEIGTRLAEVLLALAEPEQVNHTPLAAPSSAPVVGLDGLTEDDTIASYSTPELSVTRRSVSDQIKLERHRASKGMPRRTRVRFDR
jgi:hypothetical protein